MLPGLAVEAPSQDPDGDRIEELERRIEDLTYEVKRLKYRQYGEDSPAGSPLDRFTVGGYGELHANFTEGRSGDQLDIHRLVLNLGYEFEDWIRFHSETEIAHAYVSDNSDGELTLVQAHADFLIAKALNVRVGRVLTPLGIVNKNHVPTAFSGVERCAFARYIIPTTWSSDGAGIFGSPAPALEYEAYVVGGLDGSEFDAVNGIRDGRIRERQSLNEPALTSRLDFYPFAESELGRRQMLRVGLSSYVGGLDNGNAGSDPGIDADILIYSADFEYSAGVLDFRGAIAHEDIDGAREIGNGAASEILGWYLQGGCRVLPDSWKEGRLARADAVFFVRFDDVDTQYRMPPGTARDPAGDRIEWTVGIDFFLTPSFVVKADYQFRYDDTPEDPGDLINLGVGWHF